jgi:hypothetical protein
MVPYGTKVKLRDQGGYNSIGKNLGGTVWDKEI